MPTLVTRQGALTAEQAMQASRHALERDLKADADLSVIALTTEATVLGAFQRHHDTPSDKPRVRRGSGGPAVSVGPGTLHVVLALAHPSALVACSEKQIVNRYVRPLLRALTKKGALAHYFGRDWISVAHRPVGEAVFAHDTRSGRAVFEAFVAVSHPFALGARPSFMGKEPATLESATERVFPLEALTEAILDAYRDQVGGLAEAHALDPSGADEPEAWNDPPWAASVEEAIGLIGAGPDAEGVLKLGGDLLASRDAVERVARRVEALPEGAGVVEVGAIVDGELAGAGVALDGVRDLNRICEILVKGRVA